VQILSRNKGSLLISKMEAMARGWVIVDRVQDVACNCFRVMREGISNAVHLTINVVDSVFVL